MRHDPARSLERGAVMGDKSRETVIGEKVPELVIPRSCEQWRRALVIRRSKLPSDPNPFPKFHLFRWRKP